MRVGLGKGTGRVREPGPAVGLGDLEPVLQTGHKGPSGCPELVLVSTGPVPRRAGRGVLGGPSCRKEPPADSVCLVCLWSPGDSLAPGGPLHPHPWKELQAPAPGRSPRPGASCLGSGNFAFLVSCPWSCRAGLSLHQQVEKLRLCGISRAGPGDPFPPPLWCLPVASPCHSTRGRSRGSLVTRPLQMGYGTGPSLVRV